MDPVLPYSAAGYLPCGAMRRLRWRCPEQAPPLCAAHDHITSKNATNLRQRNFSHNSALVGFCSYLCRHVTEQDRPSMERRSGCPQAEGEGQRASKSGTVDSRWYHDSVMRDCMGIDIGIQPHNPTTPPVTRSVRSSIPSIRSLVQGLCGSKWRLPQCRGWNVSRNSNSLDRPKYTEQ